LDGLSYFAVLKTKQLPDRAKASQADWARIELLAMDVDGVLTDGRVCISSDGTESKQFSILDGLGQVRLMRAGVHVAWISGRASGSTTARANELKIPYVIQGRVDKLTALQELATKLGYSREQCAYMGDDIIDVTAIAWAGVGVAVPDAMPVALDAASYVTSRAGGFGAVREVCEQITSAKGLTFAP
jgi:3-deoxy-D-manno-octulosonate 8-phosphate phosphatase (KDO 8-P phosphatase)